MQTFPKKINSEHKHLPHWNSTFQNVNLQLQINEKLYISNRTNKSKNQNSEKGLIKSKFQQIIITLYQHNSLPK